VETDYTYDPVAAGVSGTGDNGTWNPRTPRLIVKQINSAEVSRSYTIFPVGRCALDIRCTVAGAKYNNAANLVTTNIFYTTGPNQFSLQSVLRRMERCRLITT